MNRTYIKKITRTLFCIFTIASLSLRGQVVNESVDFNNYTNSSDNDFVNRFNNGTGLNQITTSGITGGCLTTPATMNWGNDNAVYCSKYKGDSASVCRTSVSFKYDTTVFSSSGFDRAVSIFLRPNADFNHYVIASVSHTQSIEILTYSWTNSPGPQLNLIHNHWYDLIVRVTFTGGPSGDQIDVQAQVTDLGVTGQTPPIPVNFASGTFNDSVLFGDNAIEVSLTTTANGAAKYLDNFTFQGIKSADSCISIPTGIPSQSETGLVVFVSGKEMVIHSAAAEQEKEAEIYSLNGQLISSLQFPGHKAVFDISGWKPGIYFVRLKSLQSVSVKKIIVAD